ncbi:MAG: hypothetical protein B0A82_11765 [Alkalinema sp. CACIAM 70d]|nr:MAG: hypothetical protein B0A82_11765 [Alkalinema sp. CACIAM 70d]
MKLADLWPWVIPPIVGGIIGYFTNDIAIRMLFRPYRPWYIGNFRVPFTPGVIPRNQAKLAKRIADTIMGSLLTPDEIHGIAQRLLKVERVQAAILWILRLVLDQLQTGKEENTTKVLANILRDLFGDSLPRLLQVLAQQEHFLETQLNQIFDRILLEFQLTEEQANHLSVWLLTSVLPPDVLRQILVDFLTDRNIQILDDRFREKTSGTYWVVANLFGVRNSLIRLRTFCLDDREATNAIIKDLVISLRIQQRFQEFFYDFSLQNLPVSTVRQLRRTLRDSVRTYLRDRGADLLQGLSSSVNWENVASVVLKRLQTLSAVSESLDVVSWEIANVLERYLERDLENIVIEVLPILDIDQVIINRVMATPPEEMEAGINELVQTELQAIVNLGGVLGVAIGLLQTLSLLWH